MTSPKDDMQLLLDPMAMIVHQQPGVLHSTIIMKITPCDLGPLGTWSHLIFSFFLFNNISNIQKIMCQTHMYPKIKQMLTFHHIALKFFLKKLNVTDTGKLLLTNTPLFWSLFLSYPRSNLNTELLWMNHRYINVHWIFVHMHILNYICICVHMCNMHIRAVAVCMFGPWVIADSFVTPWTIAPQALLSMGFFRQEYWSGLAFPSPGDLPDPRIKPTSPAFFGRRNFFFTTEPPGKHM